MQVFTLESLPDAAVEKAQLLAFAGLICILIGYYHRGRRRVARLLPSIDMPWRNKKVVMFVSLCFAGLGLLVFLVTLRTKFSPETQAYLSRPSDFFYIAIVVLLILQLESELTWGYIVLLWSLLIPLHTLLGIAEG